jgi:hypothetical protein
MIAGKEVTIVIRLASVSFAHLLNSRTRQSSRSSSRSGGYSKILSISTVQPYHLETIMARVAQTSPFNARKRILIVIRIKKVSLERKSMAGFFAGVMAAIWSNIN